MLVFTTFKASMVQYSIKYKNVWTWKQILKVSVKWLLDAEKDALDFCIIKNKMDL